MSKGVLLVNLGSPDSPSVPDVRRYLNQFLMDGRVIDVAWPIRRLVVGLILIKRPAESGEPRLTNKTPLLMWRELKHEPTRVGTEKMPQRGISVCSKTHGKEVATKPDAFAVSH